MHLPADSIETTVRAMASALAPGSPLQIGVWGGSLGSIVSTFAMDGRPRPFHLRSAEENRELFIAGGSIEEEEVLDLGADGWDYQLFRLRTDA